MYQTLGRSHTLLIIGCTQELSGWKIDWLLVKKILSSNYLKGELNITFSQILEKKGTNDTNP